MNIRITRTLLVGAFVLLNLFTFGQAGAWEWMYPLPEGNDLFRIQFVDPQHGWACGQKGFLLRTTDGGANWSVTPTGVQEDIEGMHFVNANEGWFTQGAIIYHTMDGGLSWQPQPAGSGWSFSNLWFTDTERGFAVGYPGQIWRTENGGQNWEDVSFGGAVSWKTVQFQDADTGYVMGSSGTLARTTDGGSSWTSLVSPANTANAKLSVLPSGTVWVSDNGTTIWRSVDGGANWAPKDADGQAMRYVYFVDDQHGWVIDQYTIIATSDGGDTWVQQQPDQALCCNWPAAFYFLDADHGVACGSNGMLLKTANGGSTWTEYFPNVGGWMRGVYFVDQMNGYALGTIPDAYADQEVINFYTTHDGGTTWSVQIMPNYGFGQCVTFLDQNVGFIGAGSVLRTTNGGASWETYSPAVNVIDIHFVNDSTGWAAGHTIYVTHDMGNTWTVQENMPTTLAYSVHFTDEMNGWVVGTHGGIMHTVDGGSNWVQVDLGTTSSLLRVLFTTVTDGFVLSDNTLYSTVDGGNNWSAQVAVGFTDLWFADHENGWMVGNQGQISRTSDAGQTWTPEFSGCFRPLKAMHGVDAEHVYAVGDHQATMLRRTELTTSAGQTIAAPAHASALIIHPVPCGSSGASASFKDGRAIRSWTLRDTQGRVVQTGAGTSDTAGQAKVGASLKPGAYVLEVRDARGERSAAWIVVQ